MERSTTFLKVHIKFKRRRHATLSRATQKATGLDKAGLRGKCGLEPSLL